ncbi:MAG: hypothetical protein ACYTBJ_05325 [Planctomycetota bacterium]|jgi:hypothetical protein
MDKDLEKIATFYDQLGRDLYKSATAMADAGSEYGAGKKLKSKGFTNLVQKIMGQLKKG